MVGRRLVLIVASASLVSVGCGGDAEAPEAQPAANQATPPAQTDPPAEPRLPSLQRELFSYQGTGRDPFLSLMQTGDVRPLLQDLRVTSVTYDTRNPRNSVAVLRDTVENKAYPVHVGDELGRMRILAIRPGEVEVVVQEFGSDRRIVIRQRRRGGAS